MSKDNVPQSEFNWQWVDTFRALAETLSFSAAADRLGIAQSNVSRQIKLLEDHLAVNLFQRTRHAVSLTQEGVEFERSVLPVTSELKQRLQAFRHLKHEEEGLIRLGCFLEYGQSYVCEKMLEFQKLHPRIEIHLSYLNESEILQGLSEGKLDFGILSQAPLLERLRVHPFMKQEISLMVPASMKNAPPETIAEAPFAAYENGDALLGLLWLKSFSRRKRPNVRFIVNSHRSILDAVAQGGILGVAPTLSLASHPYKDRIRIHPDYSFEVPLFLSYPSRDWLPKKDLALKQYLLALAKNPN